MVNVRPFKSLEDLDKPFILQAEQENEYDIKNISNWLKMPVNAFLFENDKEILAQMFFIQLGTDRCSICMHISKNAGKYGIELIRKGKKLLDFYGFGRYEAYVRVGFEQGKRLVELCGFKLEGTMKNFDNKQDYYLYSKVRD